MWLALLCVIFFLFLLNWDKIQETLRRTNFTEVVKTQRGTDEEKPLAPVAPAPKVSEPITEPSTPRNETPPGPRVEPLDIPEASPSAPAEEKREVIPSPPQKTEPRPAPERPSPASAPVRTRSASLFFVRIDDDGIIVRQEVTRSVPATDSPLTDALVALLRGPSEEELRRNLVSLIPEGTLLLSARVQGSTALLNFNEAFMYNHYGIEGYAGQLKQVVYTATAFSTVQDVQILIEGERRDYLGGEGVFIGKPLSRNSF